MSLPPDANVLGFPEQLSGFLARRPRSSSSLAASDGNSSCTASDESPRASSQSQQRAREPSSLETSRPLKDLATSKPTTKFAFVNSNSPMTKDPKTKEMIKRHVMLHIGKSRRKSNKSSKHAMNRETIVELDVAPQPSKAVVAQKVLESNASMISRFGASRDPFINYPIPMTARIQRLYDQVSDPTIRDFEVLRRTFLPIGFIDPAAFHQMLALFAIHMEHYHKDFGPVAAGQMTLHHTQAVRMVRKRMSDPAIATSDGTIGAIGFMVCHAHSIGDSRMWHLHMNGLREILRMKEMRGASQPLGSTTRLLLSVVDIAGCDGQDIRPIFPSHVHFDQLESTLPYLPPSTSFGSTLACLRRLTNPEILVLLEDLSSFTHYVSTVLAANPSVWLETAIPAAHFQPLTFRTLNIPRPGPSDGQDLQLQEVLRLAAMLYIAPLRCKWGMNPVSRLIHLRKLHVLLRTPLIQQIFDDHPALDGLRVWVLALSGMQARIAGLLEEWRELLGWARGGKACEECEELCRGIMWMDEVHGVEAKGIWEEAR